MLEIKGYKIINELYNGRTTIIYKAIDESSNMPVAIKLLKAEYPTPDELKEFQYEYDIAKNLENVDGIIKNYSMIDYRNTKAIILEDFGAESIDKIIQTKKINLKSFLVIAIKAATILSEIHKKNIIHKDIKPQNILLNPETGEVKFIDFGISSQLTKEVQKTINPDHLEGTLAYISPEQTGRMNRSIDYRTDFYSLGIAFYEILTKKLPFEATDPMELVHCHIAKNPIPPHEINEEIPQVISSIISKLMEKTAEKRYQSAYGLRADLEKCFSMLKEKGKITDFEIGQSDLLDRFQIPEKLYGREQEIAHLMKLFNKVTKGSKDIIFFSGISGIGKSALINEVHKPMVKKRGYFIAGKYDQFKKNIPYTAIIQAFQDLTKQIITESDERVNRWKEDILDAVGTNGQVITNIIPEVEMIIGDQPDVQELPPSEAQNRFNMVFQNFIRVFASKEHPLVMFLDDMQWADNASLNLLEVLMTDPELKYLLFLGAYRDNEIDKSHPLSLMHGKLKKDGLTWENIKITPLEEQDIANLISETINTEAKKVGDLAHLVFTKTGGNPFFVIEFLKELYNDKLLYFRNGWKWNLNKIEQTGITDNVIELMATKIQKLPKKTLAVMKVACCIGVKFYLDTLSIAYGRTESETFNDLMPAINEGMIISFDNDIKFVHDKVREATYSLIADNEQRELHYKIGNILLNSSKYNKSKDRVFSIVSQLNLAHSLLKKDERVKVANLNYQAGLKAKKSTAYESAVDFFRKGEKLLDKGVWETDYRFAVDFYTEWTEAEYLARNYDESDKLCDLVLTNATDFYDKVKIYGIRIDSRTNEKKYDDAISEGINALKILGVKLPKKASQLSSLGDIINAMLFMRKRKTEDLITLPTLEDKKKIAQIELMMKLISATVISNPNLMIVIVMKVVVTSMKYGNTHWSSFAYVMYGYVLAGGFGMLKQGYEFCALGKALADQYNSKIMQGKSHFVYGVAANHLKHPLKNVLSLFQKARAHSFQAGDLEYGSYTLLNEAYSYIFVGLSLSSYKNEFYLKYKEGLYKLKQENSSVYFNIWSQLSLNLLGESDDVLIMKGDAYDEEFSEPKQIEAKDNLGLSYFYVSKIILFFLFEKYKPAIEYIQKTEPISSSMLGSIVLVYFHFIKALTLLGNTKSIADMSKQDKKSVGKIIAILKKYSASGPMNYKHKYLLCCAELARITDKNIKVTVGLNSRGKDIIVNKGAIELYDLAIKGAHDNGFTHEEAIANECTAKYYLSIGAEKAASAYMQEARYCYEKWGATTKVEMLDEKYPDLLSGIQLRATGPSMMTGTLKATTVSTASTGKVSTGPTSSFLDMGTIMKSSQTLASEIEMQSLLTKMIRILIENAGAQKGLLILANDAGKLFIEAEGNVDKKDVNVLLSIPLDQCHNLSPAVVRYVAKTKESVVIDDATTDSTYANDQYIMEKKPLSVLCTPIINQGRLAAILYLENNLSTAAFTENRVEVLNVLSTQAAISIENARLIEGMKEKERLKQEMEIAERIQTSLVPAAPKHDELDIAVCMEPAEEVGGDYYDVLFDQENKLWFAIGDVTGHGVTPGLIMMMAATSFNTDVISSKGKTPRDAMITVNQVLTQNVRKRLKETHFMTMSFMKYDEGGKFTYTGAHCDIVVFRKKTGKCDLYETKGIYLGIKADISKVTLNKNFNVDVDDIVVIYTDGVIESRHKDDRNKLMGMDILQDIIIQNSNENANKIMEAIKKTALEWCAYKPDDDITMVVAKRTK